MGTLIFTVFVAVCLSNPFALSSPVFLPNIDTQSTSGDVLLRLTKLLFPQARASNVGLQPDVPFSEGNIWRGLNEEKVISALILAFFQMSRVLAKLEERILSLIDESEPKLLKNINSGLVLKEDLLINDLEQEKRLKIAQDEGIENANKVLYDKLYQVALLLERKISAVNETALGHRVDDFQKLDISDTRSKNFTPAQYRNKGVGIYHEFKHNEFVGLPQFMGYPQVKPVMAGFSVFKTIVPWVDTTGGSVTQIAYAGNAIRMRSDDVSNPEQWSNWHKAADF